MNLRVVSSFLLSIFLLGTIGEAAPQQSTLSEADRKADRIIRQMPQARRDAMLGILGHDPYGREERLMQVVAMEERLNNEKGAVDLLFVGVQLDFPKALFRIGQWLLKMDDVQPASRAFQRAADQGHVHAQYELGVLYAEGKGVDRDLRQAATWLQKASDGGLLVAQQKLQEVKKSLGE